MIVAARAHVVRVSGFSDATGTNVVNMFVSYQRAKAVAEQLKNDLALLGDSDVTFSVVARGNEDPVASNATKDGQTQNRRVVISTL